jgi:hypothetical protein
MQTNLNQTSIEIFGTTITESMVTLTVGKTALSESPMNSVQEA